MVGRVILHLGSKRPQECPPEARATLMGSVEPGVLLGTSVMIKHVQGDASDDQACQVVHQMNKRVSVYAPGDHAPDDKGVGGNMLCEITWMMCHNMTGQVQDPTARPGQPHVTHADPHAPRHTDTRAGSKQALSTPLP